MPLDDLDLFLDPVAAAPVTGGRQRAMLLFQKRVTSADLRSFILSLAGLLKGGIPLLKAIELIREHSGPSEFQQRLLKIAEAIRQGEDFSGALRKESDVFPEYMRSVIYVGEVSGKLDAVLLKLGSYLKREDALKKQIIQALTYPLLVLSFALITLVSVFHFVIPKLAGVYSDLGGTLPRITQWLIAMSQYALPGTALFVTAVTMGAVAAFRYEQKGNGLVLRLPLFGKVAREAFLYRFAMLMSLLLSSGVTLLESLRHIEKTTREKIIKTDIRALERSLTEGNGMAQALKHCSWVLPTALILVRTGEETGTLEDMMRQIADETESRLYDSVEWMMQFLEPILIMAVGLIIGGIVIAVMLPMLQVNMLMS